MLTDYFDIKGVDYRSSGKNVARDWIGVCCPWCPDGDYGYHLGINLSTNLITCWRCKTKGHAVRLVAKLEGISFQNAEIALKKYIRVLSSIERKSSGVPQIPSSPTIFKHLSQTKNALTERVSEWLSGRGFDPDQILRDYDVRDGGVTGRFKHRALIPITMYRRVVNLVGRDITGKAEIPYLALPNPEAHLDLNNTLYNLDRASQTAIVVEGVTDVWKIGEGAVATFGMGYSPRQVSLLSHFQRVFVMFDAEPLAQEMGGRLAYDLSTVVPEVQQVELDEGDPGSMSTDDVAALRLQIFGRKR